MQIQGTSNVAMFVTTMALLILLVFPQGARAFVALPPSMPTGAHRSPAAFLARALGDDANESKSDVEDRAPLPFRRALMASTAAAVTELVFSQNYVRPGFRRVKPTQFMAALGDPNAREGTGAEAWGMWAVDPGPRGVPLDRYATDLFAAEAGGSGGKPIAPAGWEFDPSDFWLEEHGLIMEAPVYDVPTGRYLVTGGRARTSILTVNSKAPDGSRRWSLDDGVLYDITHLPCRSARYEVPSGEKGSPAKARGSDFPVRPGAEMPPIEGCAKHDYAVLFVTGIEAS